MEHAVNEPNWAEIVSAVAGVLTPVAIAVLGFVIARRQSRNELLLKARFEAYNKIAPDLNRMMCYLTFIGTWRDDSPLEIIELKRRLDANFHVVAPLFSPEVETAYRELMDLSFATFGLWGKDAVIRSGAYRRSQSWGRPGVEWSPSWNELFEIPNHGTVSGESLSAYRRAYDSLISRLVNDLNVTRARSQYTTPLVSLNASAPRRDDIDGAPA